MVYLTVDKDGEENLWDFLPVRNEDGEYWAPIDKITINATMPTGSIESLIDKRLTWDDDPYPIDDTFGIIKESLLIKAMANIYDDSEEEDEEDGIIQEYDFVTIKEDSDFFDVPDCAYDAILGKTFKCGELGSIMCVTGMPMMKGRESYEFLYEIYEYVLDSWEPQDYIWLQESAYGKYGKDEYKCLCLNTQTEMNIASESMFHLGKDGNLYRSYDYEEYYRFTECSSEEFNKARKEALENCGEYKVE